MIDDVLMNNSATVQSSAERRKSKKDRKAVSEQFLELPNLPDTDRI